MHRVLPLFLSLATASLMAPAARATYSIVAVDPMTGQCGVAVQTDNLAVGASVPAAQAGVGAIASQFETNPRHGPRGLALLAEGKSPAEALAQLLAEDGNFEGRGIEARQLALVSQDGRVAVHTGIDAAAAHWAGSRQGKGYSVQGNGLAGPQVLAAMEEAFLKTPGPLAGRLLAALSAGDAAGGQQTGRESAALLVRTPDGFPLDTDLRVDHADDPVGQLRQLYDLQTSRQLAIQARLAARRGDIDQARILLDSAVARAGNWPRAWLLAAAVAVETEQPTLALRCLTRAFAGHPAWIPKTLGEGAYAILGANPEFKRWIDPALTSAVLADLRGLNAAGANDQERLALSARLLEVDRPREALAVLSGLAQATPESHLLAASACSALGRNPDAIAHCQAGLVLRPGDPRLKFRLVALQSPVSSP